MPWCFVPHGMSESARRGGTTTSTPFDAFNTALGTQITNITAGVNTNLPVLLGLAGLVVGVMALWRLGKRFIGGR